jgi:hypothetical protein
MKILQTPVTAKHKSSMFFDGVVAVDGNNSLVTYQDGEMVFNDKPYIGAEIRELGKKGLINDDDINDETIVDIFVDKFFVISYNGEILEDMLYTDYDEALEEFQNFLNKI